MSLLWHRVVEHHLGEPEDNVDLLWVHHCSGREKRKSKPIAELGALQFILKSDVTLKVWLEMKDKSKIFLYMYVLTILSNPRWRKPLGVADLRSWYLQKGHLVGDCFTVLEISSELACSGWRQIFRYFGLISASTTWGPQWLCLSSKFELRIFCSRKRSTWKMGRPRCS